MAVYKSTVCSANFAPETVRRFKTLSLTIVAAAVVVVAVVGPRC